MTFHCQELGDFIPLKRGFVPVRAATFDKDQFKETKKKKETLADSFMKH